MSVNLTYKAKHLLDLQLRKVVNDAERYMKSVAPAPGKNKPSRNRNLWATGTLRDSIKVTKISGWPRPAYEVGSDLDYAEYADRGRGSITKKYRMRFRGLDGGEVRTYHVRGYEGWEFVRKTRDYIARTYGR